MSEAKFILPGGVEVPFLQMLSISEVIQCAGGPEHCHSHPNECGCCWTVHTPGLDYVIGPDGRRDVFKDNQLIWGE